MAAYPVRKAGPRSSQDFLQSSTQQPESPGEGFRARSVHAYASSNEHAELELRTYTEVQVADMLQVSRSQLRKWRMGWKRGRPEGPPFKKMGRIIRYTESGLRAYLYGP